MNFEALIMMGLPLVLTASQPMLDQVTDETADKVIALVHDSETKIDDVTVKALTAQLKRFCERVESRI